MRKLFALMMLATAGHAYAQNTSPGNTSSSTATRIQAPIQFGLKGGVNLANVKSKIYENSTNSLSWHAGGLAHIHISPHFAIQPEVIYSRQGFEQHISSGLDMEVDISYINVPVLLQYMFRGARIQTGPQLGFLVDGDAELTDGTKYDMDEYLKDFDFSWSFGVSYLTTSGLGIDARYNLGISNINDKITAPGITDTEISNRVWQFGIFYQFRR